MSVEELIEGINKIEEEIYKIFDIVVSEEDISSYKGYLLQIKLDILENSLDNLIDAFYKIAKEKENKNIERVKYIKRMKVVSIVMGVFIPILPIILFYIINYYTKKKVKEENKVIKSFNMNSEKEESLRITLNNCITFLESRVNENISNKEGELEDINLKTLDLGFGEYEIDLIDNEELEETEEYIQYDYEKEIKRVRER